MGIRSFSEDNSPFQVNQKYIRQKLIEEIKDSSNLLSDKNHLRKEFKKNGYLFFRNFIPTKSLKKARTEIIQKLESVGEVKIFENTPIATGRSERRSKEKNLGTYWKSVSEGKNLEWWHPLVSGDPSTVHDAGISVRTTAISEDDVINIEDYIVDTEVSEI